MERERRAAEAAAVVEYALYLEERSVAGVRAAAMAKRWMEGGRHARTHAAEQSPKSKSKEEEGQGRPDGRREGGRRWQQDGWNPNQPGRPWLVGCGASGTHVRSFVCFNPRNNMLLIIKKTLLMFVYSVFSFVYN